MGNKEFSQGMQVAGDCTFCGLFTSQKLLFPAILLNHWAFIELCNVCLCFDGMILWLRCVYTVQLHCRFFYKAAEVWN